MRFPVLIWLIAIGFAPVIFPGWAKASETIVIAQTVPPAGSSGQLAPAGARANAGSDHCISYLARNGAFWGNPNDTNWQPQNAVWLCENNQDFASPPEPVRCFSAQMVKLNNWQEAIGTCRMARGLAFGAPGQLPSANQAAAGPLPATGGNLAAVPGATVTVSLQNGLNQSVDIYYIDAGGDGQFLQEIPANGNLAVGSQNGIELVFALDGNEFANYRTGPNAQQEFAISRGLAAGAAGGQASPRAPQAALPAGQGPLMQGGSLLQGPPIPGSPFGQSGQLPLGGGANTFVPGQPKLITNPGQPRPLGQASGNVLGNANQGGVRSAKVNADCAATRIASERAICQRDDLVALQVEVNSHYVFLNGQLNRRRKNELIVDHQNWIATRNACARNVTCLRRNLLDRSEYLTEYLE